MEIRLENFMLILGYKPPALALLSLYYMSDGIIKLKFFLKKSELEA